MKLRQAQLEDLPILFEFEQCLIAQERPPKAAFRNDEHAYQKAGFAPMLVGMKRKL